jgi:hypothetical protein
LAAARGRKCLHRIAGSPSTQVTGCVAAVVGCSIRGRDNEAVADKDRGGNIVGLAGGLGSVVCARNPVANWAQETLNTGSATDKAGEIATC